MGRAEFELHLKGLRGAREGGQWCSGQKEQSRRRNRMAPPRPPEPSGGRSGGGTVEVMGGATGTFQAFSDTLGLVVLESSSNRPHGSCSGGG